MQIIHYMLGQCLSKWDVSLIFLEDSSIKKSFMFVSPKYGTYLYYTLPEFFDFYYSRGITKSSKYGGVAWETLY